MSRRVLLTGATGFVGGALVPALLARGGEVVAVARGVTGSFDRRSLEWVSGDICSSDLDWVKVLSGVDVVVHLAGRVHVMDDGASNPLAAYRAMNVEATRRLAEAAVAAGVRRFVFASSIKVNGESTGRPHAPAVFRPDDEPKPVDPYGVSKLEAERVLFQLSRNSSLETVVIRPPLVYGPGVKANFLALMHWLRRGVPLPLGAVHNRRSLVALDNLVDLIVTCVDHPAAANQVFLAGDGEDLSTTDLLRRLAAAMEVPARLVPVPAWALEAGAAAVGRRALAQRLCGSLQVDISKTRELLGWTPPVSVDEGLRKAAAAFRG